MFGDNILATVLCEPADAATGLTERSMWFPAGNDWYDMATGRMYKGGTEAVLHYTIAENPWFVKAASVIPMSAPDINSLQQESNELRILVAPGVGESVYSHYEDDGTTQAYATEYATTLISNRCDGRSNEVVVSARQGSYRDMNPVRRLSVVFERVFAPESVTVNGVEIPYERRAEQLAEEGRACWGYDGASLSAVVYLPEGPALEELRVVCRYRESDIGQLDLLDGAKGLIHRMMDITPETKIVFSGCVDSMQMLPVPFLKVAQAGSIINADPFNAAGHLAEMDVKAMCEDFNSNEKLPDDFKTRISAHVKID